MRRAHYAIVVFFLYKLFSIRIYHSEQCLAMHIALASEDHYTAGANVFRRSMSLFTRYWHCVMAHCCVCMWMSDHTYAHWRLSDSTDAPVLFQSIRLVQLLDTGAPTARSKTADESSAVWRIKMKLTGKNENGRARTVAKNFEICNKKSDEKSK